MLEPLEPREFVHRDGRQLAVIAGQREPQEPLAFALFVTVSADTELSLTVSIGV
jgi:hypothetical protein